MDELDLQAIGKRISERRTQLNFTQEGLAGKMGVSIQMVSNLERGNKAIKIENLIKIAKILKISTDYILLGERTAQDTENIAGHISRLAEEDYQMIELLVEYCLSKKTAQR